MNYCVYLRKRKNKPYCKFVNEEISLSQCWECVNKEYHLPVNRKMVPKRHQLKKDKNELVKNCHQLKRKTLNKQKMRLKSKKLAKLERNRFSVFTDNKDKCMFCPSTANLTWHEIFAGRNRKNSMEDGFCLRMCLYCHEEKQENVEFNEFWHKKAQMYYEEFIGSREQFLSRYRRNYLDKKKRSKH